MYNKSILMTQFCDVIVSQQSLPRARIEFAVSNMGIEHDDLDKLLQKQQNTDWTDGSTVKNAHCSYKVP